MSVTRAQFDGLRQHTPGANNVLIAALAAEVRRLAAVHVEALYLSADKRLFRHLVEAAHVFGSAAPITIPLALDEIAQLARISRPAANQLMVEARDAGAIGQLDHVDRVHALPRHVPERHRTNPGGPITVHTVTQASEPVIVAG